MFKKLKALFLRIYSYIAPEKYARKVGVQVGEGCRLMGANFGTEPYLVSIGNHVLTASGVSFITHEGGHWVLKGLDKEKYQNTFGYGRITVGNNVYIGSDVTVLRGVTIGDNVIVGAKSLVNKSLPANGVYAGVPAKRICSLEEWEQKFMADMPEFDLDNYKRNKKEEILRIVDQFRTR